MGTFCNVLSRERDSFALALPATRRASEQYGVVTNALDGEPPSDWRTYAEAYDSEPFTWRKVSRQNPQSSVGNVHRSRVHRPEPELCLRTEQVYHNSRFYAIGSRKHNGYQTRANVVRIAVPPFLRTAEAGGFLEVFL